MDVHEVAAIDVTDGGYLIRCACGWTAVLADREELVERWNDHRAKADAPT